jgi:serine protease AprX
MAAPVVSGIVATLLQVHPDWTPNMVKGALTSTATPVAGSDAGEVNAVAASNASGDQWTANQGLVPNVDSGFVLNPIDLTQSSWSQSSWSQSSWSQSSWSQSSWSQSSWSSAPDSLTAGWAQSSWSQSSWSQSSWSQSSWSQSSWTGIPDPSEGAHAATLAPTDATSGN